MTTSPKYRSDHHDTPHRRSQGLKFRWQRRTGDLESFRCQTSGQWQISAAHVQAEAFDVDAASVLEQMDVTANRTQRRACEHGILPAIRIGTAWRVRSVDVPKILSGEYLPTTPIKTRGTSFRLSDGSTRIVAITALPALNRDHVTV